MHLTQISDHLTVIDNIGLTSRMEIILSGFRIIADLLLHSDTFQIFFHNTLHGKEIAIAVHSESELNSFVRIVF